MKQRIQIIIPGAPVPCARPRSMALMRNGKPILDKTGRPVLHTYMPDETMAYEKRVELFTRASVNRVPEWRSAYEQKLPVRVHAHFVRQQWRGDWDNFAKGAIDGMANAGCVFFNDNRVTQALISVHTDPKDEPRTEITFETANAMLVRPLWQQCAVEAEWCSKHEWQAMARRSGWTPPANQIATDVA